jgi:hypothetical protein
MGTVFWFSIEEAGGPWALARRAARWYDPVFLQYNLLLTLFCILVVPLITMFYCYGMHDEKSRRLKSALPEDEFRANETTIRETLRHNFHLANYAGSMLATTIVVSFGAAILLLLKVMPAGDSVAGGVDYGRGANFLLLGTDMKLYAQSSKEYIDPLIMNLTAFQFGFLGAYVYFVGHVLRFYFTLDLSPNTFIDTCVRMLTASTLALLVAFMLRDVLTGSAQTSNWAHAVPVVSFFIGYFPSRGLALIRGYASGLLKLATEEDTSTPLARLPGMSYANALRLEREGHDNAETLAQADALDLALRTGFSYPQLARWIDQARLAALLGPDYAAFRQATGLSSASELVKYRAAAMARDASADPFAGIAAVNEQLAAKMRIVGALVS